MAVGAVYLPWLLGMAGQLGGASGRAVLLGPGLLAALPFNSILGKEASLALAAASTYALIWFARRLLAGTGYGFLAFFVLLTAASLWLGRMMST